MFCMCCEEYRNLITFEVMQCEQSFRLSGIQEQIVVSDISSSTYVTVMCDRECPHVSV